MQLIITDIAPPQQPHKRDTIVLGHNASLKQKCCLLCYDYYGHVHPSTPWFYVVVKPVLHERINMKNKTPM